MTDVRAMVFVNSGAGETLRQAQCKHVRSSPVFSRMGRPCVEAKNRGATLARMDYAPLGNEKRRQNDGFFEETQFETQVSSNERTELKIREE